MLSNLDATITAQLDQNSTLTFADSVFEDNVNVYMEFVVADKTIQELNASVIFRNCTFRNNRADMSIVSIEGIFGVNTAFQDCVFDGNKGYVTSR